MAPPPMNHAKAKIILLEMRQILNSLNIEFFLVCGTCLGAYRDKAFCNGDRDIDFGIKHEILVPKIAELRRVLSALNYVVKTETDPYPYDRAVHCSKNGIRLDLVDYALNPYTNERFCANARRDYCLVHRAAEFDNLREINFYGEVFKIPHPVEEYLAEEFGDSWRTPDPNDTRSRSRVHGYWGKQNLGGINWSS